MGVVEQSLASEDKLSFFDAAPVVKPANAYQAAVADTAATNVVPYGFSEAQANGLISLVNAMRSALVDLGLIKGGA